MEINGKLKYFGSYRISSFAKFKFKIVAGDLGSDLLKSRFIY